GKLSSSYFFFQAEDGIRDFHVTGVQTCALPILAQTALLHKPQDLSAAKPYVFNLVEAEKQDAKFEQYGFKPEQLWTMQQQIYGQAMTPVAKSVNTQVQQANQL